MKKFTFRLPNKYFTPVLVIIEIVAILSTSSIFVYKYREAITKAISAGTTIKSDSFTELYFDNNENLPQKPSVILNYDAVPYTFSFTIHNVEHADMSYEYEVLLSGETNTQTDGKTVFIKNGATKTIPETFILPNNILTRTKVTVRLINTNEEIFFWTGGGAK